MPPDAPKSPPSEKRLLEEHVSFSYKELPVLGPGLGEPHGHTQLEWLLPHTQRSHGKLLGCACPQLTKHRGNRQLRVLIMKNDSTCH